MWKPRQLRCMADVLFISGITVRPHTRFDWQHATLLRQSYRVLVLCVRKWSCGGRKTTLTIGFDFQHGVSY